MMQHRDRRDDRARPGGGRGPRRDAAPRARVPRPDAGVPRQRAAQRPGSGRERAAAVRRRGRPHAGRRHHRRPERRPGRRCAPCRRRTGLHIVRGAGFYRRAYFPPELDALSTDAVADLIVRDIEEGVDGVRAGIIGEIGCDRHITALEERVVPGRGARPPAYRSDHHHARRPLAGRHRPARPARRGGRRPGPGGDRALRHGAGPRLPPRAGRAGRVDPVRHRAGRARVGHPAAARAGCAAWPTRGTSTGCCSARTSACAATTRRWAGRATPTS